MSVTPGQWKLGTIPYRKAVELATANFPAHVPVIYIQKDKETAQFIALCPTNKGKKMDDEDMANYSLFVSLQTESLPTLLAQEEEIERLKRVADQAITVCEIRLEDSGIKCPSNWRPTGVAPELADYLRAREAAKVVEA